MALLPRLVEGCQALLRLPRPWHAETKKRRRVRVPPSGFAGSLRWFPPQVTLLTSGGTCATTLSYRDLEEIQAERGIDVGSVTLYRSVQRFTPELIDARPPPSRHSAGDRSFVTGWHRRRTNNTKQYANNGCEAETAGGKAG